MNNEKDAIVVTAAGLSLLGYKYVLEFPCPYIECLAKSGEPCKEVGFSGENKVLTHAGNFDKIHGYRVLIALHKTAKAYYNKS